MKKAVAIIAAIASVAPEALAVSLEFEGLHQKPITVEADMSSGLESVYVLRGTSGVRAVYPSASAKWSRFTGAGAAYATPMESMVQGTSSSVELDGSESYGLLVEDNGRQYCFWIINYDAMAMRIDAVDTDNDEFNCDFLSLSFKGMASPIYYYSINGRRIELSRDISISFNTLVFNETSQRYEQSEYSVLLPSMSAVNHVGAPLCDTRVSVSGDRFLRAWGEELHAETGTYRAVAVAAATRAEQAERDADNEQKPGGSEALGGSAPCEITFTAEVTDAVAFSEWQVSRDPEFGILENSYSDLTISPTFTENGTLYVRFTCANADGTCSYTGETYEVGIGESKLTCPNAFTPDTSPGVNDEWKVSYQSIVEFKCDIFNRWGTKLATLTHPSQGWDGKHRGKSVGPGVYYYVINARGADGKEYKLSGDINIVGSRERGNYSAD